MSKTSISTLYVLIHLHIKGWCLSFYSAREVGTIGILGETLPKIKTFPDLGQREHFFHRPCTYSFAWRRTCEWVIRGQGLDADGQTCWQDTSCYCCQGVWVTVVSGQSDSTSTPWGLGADTWLWVLGLGWEAAYANKEYTWVLINHLRDPHPSKNNV